MRLDHKALWLGLDPPEHFVDSALVNTGARKRRYPLAMGPGAWKLQVPDTAKLSLLLHDGETWAQIQNDLFKTLIAELRTEPRSPGRWRRRRRLVAKPRLAICAQPGFQHLGNWVRKLASNRATLKLNEPLIDLESRIARILTPRYAKLLTLGRSQVRVLNIRWSQKRGHMPGAFHSTWSDQGTYGSPGPVRLTLYVTNTVLGHLVRTGTLTHGNLLVLHHAGSWVVGYDLTELRSVLDRAAASAPRWEGELPIDFTIVPA